MKWKLILSIFFISIIVSKTSYGEEGFIEGVAKEFAKGVAKGVAEEGVKRFMSTVENGKISGVQGSNNKKRLGTWESNKQHPVYDNVISTYVRGEWRPRDGYIWQNPYDKNDWSVMPRDNHKKIFQSSQTNNKNYKVVYKGRDGVNIRSSPRGKYVLATVYYQDRITLKYLSSETNSNWKKFKVTGWMVRKSKKTNNEYLSENPGGVSTIIWDGNGNPRDNFVNIRANTDFKSNVVARVYTNTSVRVINTETKSKREWVKVELIGWMLEKTSKGTILLSS